MSIHINRFLDKMSVVETRQNKDVVLTISDARGLRDDITRLLADLHELNTKTTANEPDVIQIEVKGGSFK